MNEIELTNGKVAIVDDGDYERLRQHKWYASQRFGIWYARRKARDSEGRRIDVLMHREILGAPSGIFVDHADGDGLNNTRANLRLCTVRENSRNQKIPANNRTGFKGVSFEWGKYRARINVNGKMVGLGSYRTASEAALAYNDGAKKFFGEFARLNIVPDNEEKMGKVDGGHWTSAEDDKLIEVINTYRDNQHWVRGQRKLAWAAISDEVGRTVRACKNRFKRLRDVGCQDDIERANAEQEQSHE